ncbi:DUF488 domain-containing protein [Paenibacillus nanensis]|uniref:DUF488 domain-containing protein n=1 Tax=Paenibacillus nanensis TaxID=393251 RepID=A0A3A1VGD5_9BACL|nr:DUF488 domain-containing protein [Paenibacillus nanensis]RIX59627.1 DUF488 domain-containing protein [Paenibacillus nanensis]
MTHTGQLFTSNPAGLKKIDFDASILLITRAGPEIDRVEIVRDLAPSPQLFQALLSKRKASDNYDWWPEFEEKFNFELQSGIKLQALRDVYKRLRKGENVVLVCFCKDHRYCHRRLVGKFFDEYGYTSTELNPVTVEQMTLF